MFCKWHPTPPLPRRCNNSKTNLSTVAKELRSSSMFCEWGGSAPPPTPPRHCVMQARCQKFINGSKKPVCSDCRRLFADGRPPQPPRYLVTQVRCKKNNLSTFARSQCVLIFVRVFGEWTLGVYRPPNPIVFPRYPSGALLPFLFWGLLTKAAQ